GNSVLYGGGSPPDSMWTRHLQAALGDEYRVLNLAMPGETPFEFASTAAEFLVRDYPKLILITNTWVRPGQYLGDPDGRPELRDLCAGAAEGDRGDPTVPAAGPRAGPPLFPPGG